MKRRNFIASLAALPFLRLSKEKVKISKADDKIKDIKLHEGGIGKIVSIEIPDDLVKVIL